MSIRQDIQDYDDMTSLMQAEEWRVWVKFIRNRVSHMEFKVVRLVRDKNFDEAVKTVAVIDDMKRQIEMFINMRSHLEEKVKS